MLCSHRFNFQGQTINGGHLDFIDDFYGHQSELTTRVLNGNVRAKGAAAATAKVIDKWSAGREPLVARTAQLLEELKAAGNPDLAMLAVANRQMKSMVSG